MATHTAPDVWEIQGRQVDLPVEFTPAVAGALWRPERQAVDAQLEPFGLRSAGFGGRGLALLMCVVYPEFVLGEYDEVGLLVLAQGPGGGPALYTLELPVTGEFTREAGREIWGLPKWLMTSTSDVGGARSTMDISDGDVQVMDATIRTSRRRIPLPIPGTIATLARAEDGPYAGRLLRGKGSTRMHGVRIGRGRHTTITWGEHRMADRARSLGMDRAPLLAFATERVSGSLGESRVVDG